MCIERVGGGKGGWRKCYKYSTHNEIKKIKSLLCVAYIFLSVVKFHKSYLEKFEMRMQKLCQTQELNYKR